MCEHEWSVEFMKFIDKNKDKPWNWHWVSENSNITMDIISENMDKPWDWRGISWNDMNLDKMKFMKQKSIRRMLVMYKRKEGLIGALPMDVVRYISGFI